MDLLDSKEKILNEVNQLFENYHEKEVTTSQKMNDISQELSMVHQMNHKLMKEIEEKDKLLLLNEKKCYDYEVMINKIQEDANKEVDDKTRHDMLRAQDKEIFNRDKEIKRLQKKVNDQEETIKLSKVVLVEEKVLEVEEVEEVVEEVVEEKVVEKVKNVKKVEGVKKVEVDDVEKVKNVKKVEEKVKKVEEKVKKVEEVKVDDVEEVKKVEKVVEVDGETTEELSEEEEITVTTIKYYGKEYYIIDGETPQYIYAIEDGELGDKKGEMIKGKKKMYCNTKN